MSAPVRFNPILIATSVVAALSACGQNPHLIGPAKTVEPIVEPRNPEEPKPSPSPSATQSPTPSPSASPTPSVTPSPCENGDCGAPVVIVVPPGQPGAPGAPGTPGRDGQNGRDGRDGRDACGVTYQSVTASAKAMTYDELKAVVFPYKSTSSHKILETPIGKATYVTASGLPYNYNTQVQFKISPVLPPRDALKDVAEAKIVLSMSKLVNQKYPGEKTYLDTEIFCLLDIKKCSGKKFTAANFLANINTDFFSTAPQAGIASDAFSQVVLDSATQLPGQVYYSSSNAELDLKKAFPELAAGDGSALVDYLYQGAVELKNGYHQRSLPIVIADDTFVGSAQLELLIQVDTCKID